MKKEKAQSILLGVFLFVGVCVFVFLLFSVGGGGWLSRKYYLYSRFKNVKGLHKGSEVSLAGLRVGIVKAIVIDEKSRSLVVKMAIDKGYRDYIRLDSEAVLRRQGLLGDRYIEISLGDSSSAPLEPGSFIQAREEFDLFSEGKGVLEKLSQKLDRKGSLAVLLENLKQFSYNLNQITYKVRKGEGTLHNLIYKKEDNLDKVLNNLASITAKIDKGQGTLGALVNDPTLYEDMKYILGGARRSTILKYFIRQLREKGK